MIVAVCGCSSSAATSDISLTLLTEVDNAAVASFSNYVFVLLTRLCPNYPYKVNGVPLHRINQAYVITTSGKMDLGSGSFEKFDDAYFKYAKEGKRKATEEELFEAGKACVVRA
ncbi:60S ribosomal protein L6 [Rhizophlyctis rosea]|nr:60S ribosomal protein L6 [Rhizophlyctis rosea]